MLAPNTLGPWVVSRLGRSDALLRLGLLLMVVGMVWPWIRVDYRHYTVAHGPLWILDELHNDLIEHPDTDQAFEWWWGLPLVYGFVLPGVLRSGPRPDPWVRAAATCAWIGGLTGLIIWIWASAPQAKWSHPWGLDLGVGLTAAGALLISLPSVIQQLRGHRIVACWRARPGASQLARTLDTEALRRLPPPLRELVHDARALRADLTPLQPIEGDRARMLVDLIGRLRSLDHHASNELWSHGAHASALLQSLAPSEPDQESPLAEGLRVDRALVVLEAVGLGRHGLTPYR